MRELIEKLEGLLGEVKGPHKTKPSTSTFTKFGHHLSKIGHRAKAKGKKPGQMHTFHAPAKFKRGRKSAPGAM